MAESQSACERRVRFEAALRRSARRKDRDDKTRSITELWVNGFSKLKAENDRLQVERDRLFKEDIADIESKLKAKLASGPPQGVSKSAWVSAARSEAAVDREGVRGERDARTLAITKEWKEGYAALKLENDSLQKSRDQEYKDDMISIDEVLADELEGCQV